jgi:hypothetical protein
MGFLARLFGKKPAARELLEAKAKPLPASPPSSSTTPRRPAPPDHARPDAPTGFQPPEPAGRPLAVLSALRVVVEVVGEAYYDRASWDVMNSEAGFYTDEGAERTFSPGSADGIALVPAPRNPFDKNAVAVFVRRHHIGYLPADLAQVWCRTIKAACEQGYMVTVQGRIWARSRGGGRVSTRVTLSLPESGSLWPANAYPDGDFGILSGDYLRKVTQASRHQNALIAWTGKDLLVELRDIDGRLNALIDGIPVGPLTKASHDTLAPRVATTQPTYVGGIVRPTGTTSVALEVRA